MSFNIFKAKAVAKSVSHLIHEQLTRVTIALAIVFCLAAAVSAHSTDETYIWLNPVGDHYSGEVQIRLPDLRKFLELEIPDDLEAAQSALQANAKEIEAYVRQHFEIKTLSGEAIQYEIIGIDVLESKKFKHFAKILYKTQAFDTLPEKVIVKSDMLFEFDRYTRSILCMNYSSFKDDGRTKPDESKGITEDGFQEGFYHTIFTPWNAEQEVDLVNVSQVPSSWQYYIWEGVRHIWIGTDHILFLITLLLASVLLRRKEEAQVVAGDMEGKADSEPTVASKKAWIPVDGFGGAFWNILKIVTVFTVAHSITLALASLDIISLEGWIVESIIAFSIILVALNNIFPVFHDRSWIVLFAFGLFHGMGFASVMKDLPFRMGDLRQLLFSFNIGVELGQLAIVIGVFPIIFFLRKSKFYQPVILVGGSLVICMIAAWWFYERAIQGA